MEQQQRRRPTSIPLHTPPPPPPHPYPPHSFLPFSSPNYPVSVLSRKKRGRLALEPDGPRRPAGPGEQQPVSQHRDRLWTDGQGKKVTGRRQDVSQCTHVLLGNHRPLTRKRGSCGSGEEGRGDGSGGGDFAGRLWVTVPGRSRVCASRCDHDRQISMRRLSR